MRGAQFLRQVGHWSRYLTTVSSIRYCLMVRTSARRGILRLKSKYPFTASFSIRARGSDRLTLKEILVDEVYRDVVGCAGECKTTVDLGANIGLASLYFLAAFPGSRVFAVEANQDTFRMLQRNLACKKRRCTLFGGALWSHRTKLGGDRDQGAERFSRFSVRDDGRGEIDGYSMRDLLDKSGFDQIDLLKVDIEGSEVHLFAGDVDWLSRVRTIAIEFHGDSREAMQFDVVMHRHGFRIVDENAHTVVATRRP